MAVVWVAPLSRTRPVLRPLAKLVKQRQGLGEAGGPAMGRWGGAREKKLCPPPQSFPWMLLDGSRALIGIPGLLPFRAEEGKAWGRPGRGEGVPFLAPSGSGARGSAERIRREHRRLAQEESRDAVMLEHQLRQLLPLGARVPLAGGEGAEGQKRARTKEEGGGAPRPPRYLLGPPT